MDLLKGLKNIIVGSEDHSSRQVQRRRSRSSNRNRRQSSRRRGTAITPESNRLDSGEALQEREGRTREIIFDSRDPMLSGDPSTSSLSRGGRPQSRPSISISPIRSATPSRSLASSAPSSVNTTGTRITTRHTNQSSTSTHQLSSAIVKGTVTRPHRGLQGGKETSALVPQSNIVDRPTYRWVDVGNDKFKRVPLPEEPDDLRFNNFSMEDLDVVSNPFSKFPAQINPILPTRYAIHREVLDNPEKGPHETPIPFDYLDPSVQSLVNEMQAIDLNQDHLKQMKDEFRGKKEQLKREAHYRNMISEEHARNWKEARWKEEIAVKQSARRSNTSQESPQASWQKSLDEVKRVVAQRMAVYDSTVSAQRTKPYRDALERAAADNLREEWLQKVRSKAVEDIVAQKHQNLKHELDRTTDILKSGSLSATSQLQRLEWVENEFPKLEMDRMQRREDWLKYEQSHRHLRQDGRWQL